LRSTRFWRRLGINQPKVSALANYRLEGFSVERLMHFLNALVQSSPDTSHLSVRPIPPALIVAIPEFKSWTLMPIPSPFGSGPTMIPWPPARTSPMERPSSLIQADFFANQSGFEKHLKRVMREKRCREPEGRLLFKKQFCRVVSAIRD
jgi:Helix-turn-helix domain